MRVHALLLVLCVVFCAAVPYAVVADTPANCMYEDVRGTWTFHLGPAGFNRDNINCTNPFTVESTYTVTLDYPDKVTDSAGNQGFWTMIYSMSFDVKVGGRRFFAFSKWVTDPSGHVTSVCSETLPGWYHDDGEAYAPGNWGCYFGIKTQSAPETPKVPLRTSLDLAVVDPLRAQRKYEHDFEFVDAINKAQSLWTATTYDEHLGLTIGDMERRAGGSYARQELAAAVPKPQKPELTENAASALSSALPDSWDWTNVNGVNYVSPIRNQGQCGSCYAFASAATLEARLRILSNNTSTVIISPQNVVSCSVYSHGCNGGFPYLIAGKYGHDFGHVEESCFPYVATEVSCSKRCSNPRLHWTSDYHYIGGYYGAATEQNMMEELVANGPIAVSFEVYPDLHNYKGGVYSHTEVSHLVTFNPFQLTNHVVVIVGYGTTSDGVKFWKVKNSWGTSWGEDGFFRIRRGTDECAIESMAVAVTPVV